MKNKKFVNTKEERNDYEVSQGWIDEWMKEKRTSHGTTCHSVYTSISHTKEGIRHTHTQKERHICTHLLIRVIW